MVSNGSKLRNNQPNKDCTNDEKLPRYRQIEHRNVTSLQGVVKPSHRTFHKTFHGALYTQHATALALFTVLKWSVHRNKSLFDWAGISRLKHCAVMVDKAYWYSAYRKALIQSRLTPCEGVNWYRQDKIKMCTNVLLRTTSSQCKYHTCQTEKAMPSTSSVT